MVIKIPLIRPSSRPKPRQNKRHSVMLCVLFKRETPSPDIRATEEPTERSIMPAEMTRLIPIAQIPTIAPCTNWFVRFVTERNDGLMMTATIISNMKLSQWL